MTNAHRFVVGITLTSITLLITIACGGGRQNNQTFDSSATEAFMKTYATNDQRGFSTVANAKDEPPVVLDHSQKLTYRKVINDICTVTATGMLTGIKVDEKEFIVR